MIYEIGKHRVRNGDIYDDLDELYAGQKMDIFYSDPPWGNLEYWQTLNQKMNGAERKATNVTTFVNRVFDVAIKYTKDDSPIFVEYGIKWNNHLIAIAESKGLHVEACIEMLYASPKRPMLLNIFSKNGNLNLSEDYKKSVYHTHGYNSLKTAIAPFAGAGKTITDPCCGLGYTARYAIDHGMQFYGNELNLKRLEKTMEKLRKSDTEKL